MLRDAGLRRRELRLQRLTPDLEKLGPATGPVAVTGASGFIGRALVGRLSRSGFRVRALCRRPDPGLDETGVETVLGALEDSRSLQRLLDGAEAVVHAAGAVRARSRREFEAANRGGTASVVAALLSGTRPRRLILVSSLAAREPTLSAYAQSKRMAEQEVEACRSQLLDFCILRPPAVYGPGDRATLPIFRQLARRFLLIPTPSDARFSLLFVQDLAGLVERLLDVRRWDGITLEPDDGRPGGYAWHDLAAIAGRSLGSPVRTLSLPGPSVWLAAGLGEAFAALRGRPATLGFGKLRELRHRDWVCRPVEFVALDEWTSRTQFEDGFACTLAWYKGNGWL
jgi:2-alkyl-3-oxoalkanoate reductase